MRAFIALSIPKSVQTELKDLLSALKNLSGLKTVEPQNLHLTMKFLGECSEEQVDTIKNGIFHTELHQGRIKVFGTGIFGLPQSPSVIWAGIKADERLWSLKEKIEEICSDAGFKRDKRAFSPHLTLSRVKKNVDPSFLQVVKRYENRDFGSFDYSELFLFKSTLTERGPVYEILHSLPIE